MNKQLGLIGLLESFSRKEIEGFTQFISCSYFNTNRHVIELLDVLRRRILHKGLSNSSVQDRVLNLLSGNMSAKKETQKAMLRVRIGILTQLAEQFLVIASLETEAACKNELLYKQLLKRKQFSILNRRINQFRKEADVEIKDIPYYHHQYKAENGILDYFYQSGQWIQQDNLSILNRQLDLYYLLSKMKLHITALSFMEISSQKKYDFSDIEALQHMLNLPFYKEAPLVKIYQAIIELIRLKDYHTYLELLGLLDKYRSQLSDNDMNSAYIVATNFCTHQIKSGKPEYYHQLFELYQMMDDKNLLLEGNFIPIGKLKNIVSVSCRVGVFERAVYFIEKYTSFLRKEIRNNVRNFNLGAIAFYKKDYQTAADYLYQIDNISLSYDTSRRMMLVKSYYEIDKSYKETTVRVFRSMEKFIKEHRQLTSKDKMAYKNFVRILINLYRIRHGVTTTKIKRVREKLENQHVNSDKQWLLEKAGMLSV